MKDLWAVVPPKLFEIPWTYVVSMESSLKDDSNEVQYVFIRLILSLILNDKQTRYFFTGRIEYISSRFEFESVVVWQSWRSDGGQTLSHARR